MLEKPVTGQRKGVTGEREAVTGQMLGKLLRARLKAVTGAVRGQSGG